LLESDWYARTHGDFWLASARGRAAPKSMIASILTIVFCSALLFVWVRSTACLLLRDSAVRSDSGLQETFASIRQQVSADQPLGALHDAFERDARTLVYLLRHASGAMNWEEKLLLFDYRLMRLWFRVSSVAFPAQARLALVQMTESMSALEDRLAHRAGVC